MLYRAAHWNNRFNERMNVNDEIILRDVTIGYHRRVVAEGLSAHIVGGQLTCLVGRNGTGKSTLLRTIAGFQPPLAGTVTLSVDGREQVLASAAAAGDAPRPLSQAQRARLISVVLTERPALQRLSAFQLAAMGRMPYTGFFGRLTAADRTIVTDALAQVGISALSGRDVVTLSDGERQKVMIARALAQQTPVILLDEPTAFLDYESRVGCFRLLRQLAHDQGKIVLLSTHDMDQVHQFADQTLSLP